MLNLSMSLTWVSCDVIRQISIPEHRSFIILCGVSNARFRVFKKLPKAPALQWRASKDPSFART